MPSLKTPDHTITNVQGNGLRHNPTNDQPNQIQEEPTTLLVNAQHPSGNIIQPNALSVPLSSTTHEAKLQRQLNEMEDLIRRIPGIPTPIKKSSVNSYVNSPFTDNITLVEMSHKFRGCLVEFFKIQYFN